MKHADCNSDTRFPTRRKILCLLPGLLAAGGVAAGYPDGDRIAGLIRGLGLADSRLSDLGGKLAMVLPHAAMVSMVAELRSKCARTQPECLTASLCGLWSRDDLVHGRTVSVGGIVLSHTEAALLLSLAGKGTPA
jgi:hypothetical protein